LHCATSDALRINFAKLHSSNCYICSVWGVVEFLSRVIFFILITDKSLLLSMLYLICFRRYEWCY